MPHFDLSGAELRGYNPELEEPDDFDAFWSETFEARDRSVDASFTPVENSLALIDSYDVEFAGFGGSPVRGWLNIPTGSTEPLPVVVEFVGYGGGRGLPHERLLWSTAGYAHFIMDTRGQGSASGTGVTADPDAGGEPSHPGFMTMGILDPAQYYFRRVFVDAVRSIDAAVSHPLIDASQIAVAGASQGGGVAIAATALDHRVQHSMIDVPFLCHFKRATSMSPKDPYGEIVRYLKAHRDHVDAVFSTLSYFDGAILAKRARADALFSVALMDEICPPSTVYAAYNAFGGPKTIVEYPYNNHEGGQSHHDAVRLSWLAERVVRPG